MTPGMPGAATFSRVRICLVLLALSWLPGACQVTPPAGEVTRIAFGSCNRSDLPQPLWSPILETKPDLWVWAGDIVYGDTNDMQELAAKYSEQATNPGYQALRARVPVIGTWDDHDYGANNAGAEYPQKAESQQLLLDFLGVARDDPRRTGAGVYSSHTLGEPPRQIKIYLLDVRYHRDQPGPRADLLGEAQWRWLARELGKSDAQLNLIVSGTQVLPADHEWDRWTAYPAAHQRLLDLIKSSGKPGVMFLSGDRHFAELSAQEPEDLYPLYDLTASGMTHYWYQLDHEPNRLRVGRFYKGLNFGLVEVYWDAPAGPLVRLQVRDQDNRVRIRFEFPLSRLAVAD